MSEQVKAAVIRLASLQPVEFDAAMVAVSESLSDEEFGRYSRLYKQNYQGADLVEKLTNAYDAHPATAHAMQAAALSMMQEQAAGLQGQLTALQERMAAINAEFEAYAPQG